MPSESRMQPKSALTHQRPHWNRKRDRYLAELTVELLPQWLTATLTTNPLPIAHIACGEGDASSELALLVGEGRLQGFDPDENNLGVARERFPNVDFRHDPQTSFRQLGQFSIVFSIGGRHALTTPWATARQRILELAEIDTDLLVILAPFVAEAPLDDRYWLGRESIPPCTSNGMFLAHARVTPPSPDPSYATFNSHVILIYGRCNKAVSESLTNVAEWNLSAIGDYVSPKPMHLPRLAYDSIHIPSTQVDLHDDQASASQKALHAELYSHHMEVVAAIDGLAQQVQALAQRARKEDKTLADYERCRNDLEYANSCIRLQEARVSAIFASYSWRATAPLRKLLDLYTFAARRLPHLWKGRARLTPAVITPSDAANLVASEHSAPVDAGEETPSWIHELCSVASSAILTSAFRFDDSVNQRPIHLARHLQATGRRVFFVHWEWDPPAWRGVSRAERILGDSWDIPMSEFLYWSPSVIIGSPWSASFFLTFPAPQLTALFDVLRPKQIRLIYDIMDDWEAFHAIGQAPWFVEHIECQAVLKADLVSVVSPRLREKFAPLRADIEVVPNGFSSSLAAAWKSHSGLPEPSETHSGIVGYFGHMPSAWFDWDLVVSAAQALPHVRFELIGSGASQRKLSLVEGIDNLFVFPPVRPQELSKRAHQWSTAMIPFKAGSLSAAVDPLKIYEYLLLGLPCIVTGIPHLSSYPGVDLAESADEFIGLLDERQARGLSSEEVTATKLWLPQCEWSQRFETYDRALASKPTIGGYYAT